MGGVAIFFASRCYAGALYVEATLGHARGLRFSRYYLNVNFVVGEHLYLLDRLFNIFSLKPIQKLAIVTQQASRLQAPDYR